MSEKNYDPQMHTAEHILTQTMVRMFGTSRSFSNHLERKKSKCDYHFTRPLTEQELVALEDKVNEVIAENIPIGEEFLPRAEAQSQFNLSRLPEEAGDDIRIVKVGSYDSCPCIGPHVTNTAEIGLLRILSSDYADGVLRIRFKLERPE